jgi:hypothetical protein
MFPRGLGPLSLRYFVCPQRSALRSCAGLSPTSPSATIELLTRYTFDPAKLKNWHAENEAVSLIIQTLVRSITNSHSSDEAAAILFREHRMGNDIGWLPDYLDGLPGLDVDLKRCRALTHGDMGTLGHPLG